MHLVVVLLNMPKLMIL
jgi:hypothetical protein